MSGTVLCNVHCSGHSVCVSMIVVAVFEGLITANVFIVVTFEYATN